MNETDSHSPDRPELSTKRFFTMLFAQTVAVLLIMFTASSAILVCHNADLPEEKKLKVSWGERFDFLDVLVLSMKHHPD